ncbi:MAG: type II secretion system F family protein [Phycisphaerae bacterium]
MPKFKVEFATSDGRIQTGEFESASERGVLAMLDTRGQTAISVLVMDSAATRAGQAGGRLRRGIRKSVLDFTHQMTAVCESGIPVLAGLSAVAEQTAHPHLRSALRRIANRVEGGETLADALGAEPDIFPLVYVKTVAAGESSGTLAEVFNSLSHYLEQAAETRAQVKAALLYPMLVVGALTIATIIMLVFVVPQFAAMFDKFDAQLPLPTRVLLGASEGLRRYWLSTLGTVGLIVMGVRLALREPPIRRWWDDRKLKIPIFGNLMLGAYMHRVIELLNLLTRAAMPIVQTLRITGDSMENEALRSDLRSMLRSVEGGRTLAEAFSATRWLTPLVKRMLAVGEQAGRTDQIFDYLARYYSQQTKRLVKTLSTLIEPVLIACLAGVILFFALSIFLPMLRMLKLVANG